MKLMGQKAALTSFLLTITSCATMVRGMTETLYFDSSPRGAVVRLSDGQECVTPCSLDVPRYNKELGAAVSKESCDDQTISISRALTVDGTILTGLSIFSLRPEFPLKDMEHGSAYSFKPNPVDVVLKCSVVAAPARTS